MFCGAGDESNQEVGMTETVQTPPFRVQSLDHLVLTVRDVGASLDFYVRYFGMRAERFQGERWALFFGSQKFNVHVAGAEFAPHAQLPQPGSQDFCLLIDQPVAEVAAWLQQQGVPIEQGPVERTGACQRLLSIYLRDPDGNLVELSNPL